MSPCVLLGEEGFSDEGMGKIINQRKLGHATAVSKKLEQRNLEDAYCIHTWQPPILHPPEPSYPASSHEILNPDSSPTSGADEIRSRRYGNGVSPLQGVELGFATGWIIAIASPLEGRGAELQSEPHILNEMDDGVVVRLKTRKDARFC